MEGYYKRYLIMNFTEKLQLAYKKIESAQNILIIGHISPDADAIASMGAIMEIAQRLKISFYAFADKKPEGAYDFINNEAFVFSIEPVDLKNYDLIIILDCGSIARTGIEKRLRNLINARQNGRLISSPYIIEFDHHEKQESYADLEIKEADKAATTEIIYHFLIVNHLEITKTLADCILIGLMTDTGHFLHANSSREALAIASEMLLYGASLPKIINKTAHNKSFVSLKVWGRILERIKFNPDTGLATAALLEEEIDELLTPAEKEANADLFGEIVSFMSYLSKVRVALLLREEGGIVKGSLRSNDPEIDVSLLAANWGGGGHKKAAGFAVRGRIKATKDGFKIIKQN